MPFLVTFFLFQIAPNLIRNQTDYVVVAIVVYLRLLSVVHLLQDGYDRRGGLLQEEDHHQDVGVAGQTTAASVTDITNLINQAIFRPCHLPIHFQ